MTKNQKHKLNATTWLIIPNVLLCLSIGFIGIMLFKQAYMQIRAVENEDISFNTFRLAMAACFLLGFGIKRFIKHHGRELLYLELIISALLAIITVMVYYFSTGIIQVDYIFYTFGFYISSLVIFLAAGIFLADLRNFRLWAMLLGIGTYLVYSRFIPALPIGSDRLSILFLILLNLELLLISLLARFKPITFSKHEQNKHSFIVSFFYIGIIFFISHTILFYLRSNIFLDPFLLGTIPGLLIFNILYAYGVLKGKLRLKYTLGILILIINFYFTLQQAELELIYPYLFFLDACLIGLYRPYQINFKRLIQALLLSILFVLIALNHYSYFSTDHLKPVVVVLMIGILIFPLLIEPFIQPVFRITFGVILFCIGFFAFTPIPLLYEINFEAKEIARPLPFHLSGIPFEEKNFIYYNTHLPFKKSQKLPKLNSIKNKIIVLEAAGQLELIMTYILQLENLKLPYILLQETQDKIIRLTNWSPEIKDFFKFRIYYAKSFEKRIFARQEKVKGLDYILKKIAKIQTNEEMAETLNKIIIYDYYHRQAASYYKNKIIDSYRVYVDYFYRKKDFSKTLYTINTYYLFDRTDKEINEIAYHSLLQITPSEANIPIMEELQDFEPYKEQILNRLYPLYVRQKNYKLALKKNEELIYYYKKAKKLSEIQDLQIEKAKLYLESSDLIHAKSLIDSQLRKNSDSIRWQKIRETLNFRLEEAKRRTREDNYYYDQD